MISAARVDYGHFLLKDCISQSAIFDFWYGEVRAPQAYVPCMVRRLLPPYSQGPEYVQILRARCRDIQAVRHPCMRRPLEFGVIDSIPHAVFGLEPCWNLDDLCAAHFKSHRPMPPEIAASLVLPIAHLLASVHARPGAPLVHGAIQPSAVWIDRGGMVRVSDFEIGALQEYVVRALDQNDPLRQFVAPERALQWARPGPAADVFSTGAILLDLLAPGRLTEVQLRITHAEKLTVLGRTGLPERFMRIVAACVAPDPARRPTMTNLHKALKHWLEETGRAVSLSAYVVGHAPPMPELVEMARGDDAVVRALQEVPRDSSVFAESTMTVSPANDELEGAGEDDGERPGAASLVRAFAIVAAVVVLALVGYAFRGQLSSLLRAPGSNMALVVVTSDPPGATITLPGGKTVGTAPLKVPLHVGDDGKVVLTARLRGYESPPPLSKSVKGAQAVEFHFRLEKRPPGPATARIITIPPGAKIAVDGRTRGVSPIDVGDLHSARPHQVTAKKKGYRTARQTVTLVPGEISEVILDLERTAPVTAMGQLVVVTYPNARLLVDGRELGPTGEEMVYPVAAGRRSIQVLDPATGREASYVTVIRPGVTEVLEYAFGGDRWRARAGGEY